MGPVVGHEWAVKVLQHSISQGRVSHAYLLTGPSQIGKTTLAKSFAQALNCTGDEKPCGQCRSCRKMASESHPDVKIIEGSGGAIKIDQIRALQAEAALSAYESPWKVYILRNMSQATLEAANCLLKTLEEPPGHVVLLLTSLSSSTLLPTIISRCQLLALRPLSAETVRQALIERWQVQPERADLLARLSGGRIGWAIMALQDEALLLKRSETIADLLRVATAHRVGRMQYAEQLSTQRETAQTALEVWQTWWRDMLLTKIGLGGMTVNADRQTELEAQAIKYSTEQIKDFLALLLGTMRKLEQDVNLRLALEVLFLKLPV